MSPILQRRIRVAIADDVSALRRLVRLVLEGDGHFDVVGEAGNGEEAIEVVRQTRPDLLLLDLSMPRLDGLETLPQIRSNVPETKVIVFSGFTSDRMADSAKNLGAVKYVEKGATPEELVKSIMDVFGGADGRFPGPARPGG